MSDHKYYYDEYYTDVSNLVDRYRLVKNPHVVGVYSNGLPAAVHISNSMKCPLSIVKVEDDKARWLLTSTSSITSISLPNRSLFIIHHPLT